MNNKNYKRNRLGYLSCIQGQVRLGDVAIRNPAPLYFRRGKSVEIADSYQLNEYKQPFTLSFLSAKEPVLGKSGIVELRLNSGKVILLKYSASSFVPEIEIIDQTDSRLKSNWGDRLYRILLISKEQKLKGSVKVNIGF